MEAFQHRMRTTQHTKSVQNIMTRSNHYFYNNKKHFKKMTPQGDNLTTYLRKFQINKQNQNLAKRIMLCESQHSKNKYDKQWKNIKRFMRVRSNFKKTLHAEQPKIFRFQPILGKGKLQVNIDYLDFQFSNLYPQNKHLYRISYVLGNHQIQPNKKLITLNCLKNYNSAFYAPLFLKKRSITCKILQINQNNVYETAKFTINLSQKGQQQAIITNKFGKPLGKIKFDLKVEGGRKNINQEKQNRQCASEYRNLSECQQYYNNVNNIKKCQQY